MLKYIDTKLPIFYCDKEKCGWLINGNFPLESVVSFTGIHTSLIAMYYDGVMPDEHAFTEHIFTCRYCQEKLLNLKRDLFLMKNMPLIELSRKC